MMLRFANLSNIEDTRGSISAASPASVVREVFSQRYVSFCGSNDCEQPFWLFDEFSLKQTYDLPCL